MSSSARVVLVVLFFNVWISDGQAQQPHGPLSHSKEAFYPVGSQRSQAYQQPANAGSLNAMSAAPGTISFQAATSVLSALPQTAKRRDAGLDPVLRMVTKVPLDQPGAPAAAPRSLYLFDYALEYKGVPLARFSTQSLASSVRGTQRNVLFVRERSLPEEEALQGIDDLEGNISQEAAEAAALAHAKESAGAAPLEVQHETNAPHREILVRNDAPAALTWTIVVVTQDVAKPFARQYWVSANEPARILAEENRVYHVDGKVTGNYWPIDASGLGPAVTGQPLPGCFVAPNVVSDETGSYHADGALLVDLAGPWCRISDSNGSLLHATRDGNNLNYSANVGDPMQVAQVTAFHWTNEARRFVNPFLPTSPDKLERLRTRVNINDHCNAFWDGSSLNFFRAGDGCPNSAAADVIFHEFGHGVDDQLGGIQDGGYSEGFGDALAVLMTRRSVVGKDFFGPGIHLRDTKDVVKWPPTDTEVHEVGRIYGGFVWELTRQLIAKNGLTEDDAFAVAKKLVLGAAALDPLDIPDAVKLSFVVDMQISDGGHFDAIAAAADSRAIPRPASKEVLDAFLTAHTSP